MSDNDTQQAQEGRVHVLGPSTQEIAWVGQEDANGCCVAALAMVTGHDYHAIRDYFGLDLQEYGLSQFLMQYYMVEHGFYWALKTKFIPSPQPPYNQERTEWPPKPFGRVHICEVITGRNHAVVMLADGTVLDPLTPEPKRLSDYRDVSYVMAVMKEAAK